MLIICTVTAQLICVFVFAYICKKQVSQDVARIIISFTGKSTVASLLERFYDIKQGKITIDNVSIQELDPSWLRGHAIGFINQVTRHH